MSTATFQTTVGYTYAPGIAGDFATINPYDTVPSPISPGGPNLGFVAGSGGVTMALFGWIQSDTLSVLNAGSGKPSGFIRRDASAGIITTYMGASSLTIPQGFEVNLFDGGNFWVKTTTAATRGQKIFASNTTGAAQAANAGATVAGFTETDWYVQTPCLANELTIMTRRIVS